MGNKIYNDGQQNLSERATKFIGTGNGIFTQIPLFFRKRRAYRIFFFAAHYIYMRMQKKKSISDSRAVPQKAFFFNEVGIKKAAFCARSAGWRGGERAHEKRKRLSLRKETAFVLLRRQDSNLRPLGYEPNELPLLHSAMSLRSFSIASAKVGIIFESPNFSASFLLFC